MKQNYLKRILLCLPLLIGTNALAYDVQIDNIQYNFSGNEATIVGHTPNLYYGNLVIPESITNGGKAYTVTGIGEKAFYDCFVTSVTIPNTVTSIAAEAFNHCEYLKTITFPDNAVHIGMYAFRGTAWLDNQPDGLVYAGKIAYLYKGTMPEGTHFAIEDGTLGIADQAFSSNKGLIGITIPGSVTYIGKQAFSNCYRMTSVIIPGSVTTIDDEAFSICEGMTSLTIEEGVAIVGTSAFRRCRALKEVTIPNSVTDIDSEAFSRCTDMKSVSIGTGVTSIGRKAFNECYALSHVYCNAETIPETEPDAFGGSPSWSVMLHVPAGNLASYKEILPWSGFKRIVPLEGEMENYANIDGIYYNFSEDRAEVTYGENACSGEVVIPESVTYKGKAYAISCIGDFAFYCCYDMTSIAIPSDVTAIGSNAFGNCYALTSVIIPESVASIGELAFSLCMNLTDVYCHAPEPPVAYSDNGYWIEYAFDESTIGELTTLHVPAGSLEAYKGAAPWSSFRSIVPLTDEDAIEGVKASEDAAVVARYDIQGRRVSNPLNGLNIIRRSDGTTRKVMMK